MHTLVGSETTWGDIGNILVVFALQRTMNPATQ